MNVKMNLLRVLTFVVGTFAVIFPVCTSIHFFGINPSRSAGYALLALFGAIFGFIWPMLASYTYETYKPKKVDYYKFNSHLILIVDGRVFSFEETTVMYHIIGEPSYAESIKRLSCKQGYNLVWCKIDPYELIIDPLEV